MVSLDHVSLIAAPGAIEALGFALTPTRGAVNHGRVRLDRSYLEVVADPGPRVPLRASGWFLRCDELDVAAARLRDAGLQVSDPRSYKGHDGAWLDLELKQTGPQTAALPTLTKRTDLPVGAWPPPLAEPHSNGATRLAEVRLFAPDPEPLASRLAALGATVERVGERFVLAESGAVVQSVRPGPAGIDALVFARPSGEPLVIDLPA